MLGHIPIKFSNPMPTVISLSCKYFCWICKLTALLEYLDLLQNFHAYKNFLYDFCIQAYKKIINYGTPVYSQLVYYLALYLVCLDHLLVAYKLIIY